MIRYNSIDIMRAWAIISMILCHGVIYLSNPTSGAWVYFFANHVLGDFSAPLFALLMGASFAISNQASLSEQNHKRLINMKRGIFLIVLGLGFSALVWGYHHIWIFDILPLLGVSLIVLSLLSQQKSIIILILVLLLIALAPYLRQYSDYEQSWGGFHQDVLPKNHLVSDVIVDPIKEYTPGYNFSEKLQGFFVEGEFPLFPWLAFPLLGLILGRNMGRNKLLFMLTGCVMIILSLWLSYLSSKYLGYEINDLFITPLSFYPCTTTMLLLQIGLCFILFTITQYFDGNNIAKFKASKSLIIARLLSSYSLTIYIIHHIIILWPVWLLGYLHGDISLYYTDLFSAKMSLISAMMLLMLLLVLISVLKKHNKLVSIEDLMKKN